MVCDVCEKVFLVDPNSTSDENNVLQCIQCNIKVHQLCYGVEIFSSSWLCDFCKINENTQEKKCELCPITGGVLKATTSEKWVHVICALFTPNVVIKDITTMSPIDLSNISKRCFKLSCYICEEKGKNELGACVKCFVTKCKRYLHVSCGQNALTLQEKMSNKGNLLFIVYCEDHVNRKSPPIPIKSIETVLRGRKKVNDIVKAKVTNTAWIIHQGPVSIFLCLKLHTRPVPIS